MMKNFNQRVKGRLKRALKFAIFSLIFSFAFISCQSEITLTVQKDDSVLINFTGGAGEAFTKMISGAAGMNDAAKTSDPAENNFLIDEASVTYELAKAGFSDVKIQQKKGGSVSISMCDKKQTSYIFTSGIVKCEKGMLKAAITRKSLEDFYAAADEQTRMILDLFLAPVFNDEDMTEAEYIEMVGAFYGSEAAKEIDQSLVKINLISKDGSKQSLAYPLTQIFCGLF